MAMAAARHALVAEGRLTKQDRGAANAGRYDLETCAEQAAAWRTQLKTGGSQWRGEGSAAKSHNFMRVVTPNTLKHMRRGGGGGIAHTQVRRAHSSPFGPQAVCKRVRAPRPQPQRIKWQSCSDYCAPHGHFCAAA